MAKVEPFETFTRRYEEWFEKNVYVYQSELQAVKKVLPKGTGIEIGVGTGRFATPLRIKFGVDPSFKMAKIAKERGVQVFLSTAENLPFKDSVFDYSVFITTICFVDDLEKSFTESRRVLKKDGKIVVGFIDKNSKLGRFYLENKDKSPFYRVARFYSTQEVVSLLRKTGFSNFTFVQTVFDFPWNIRTVQKSKEGYGEGSFVVICGEKSLI